jgi:hypothetical protein
MFMGRSGRLAASLSLVCFSAVFGAFVPARDQSMPSAGEDPVLKGILDNTSAYCRKLMDYAYYFVCHEAVSEKLVGKANVTINPQEIPAWWDTQTINVSDPNTTNTYLYDYQLIRRQGQNQEKRTLLEKNGRRITVADAKLEAMRFYFENFAFGPIDIFGEAGRLRHEYKIVGREKIKGDKAIIVEAASTHETAEYKPKDKVWVREGDNAILKIEWDQTTLKDFKDIKAVADLYHAIPQFKIVTEYGVEKNGIRFPSRTLFREAYLRTRSRRIQKASEVTIDYKDYRFFQVDVESK